MVTFLQIAAFILLGMCAGFELSNAFFRKLLTDYQGMCSEYGDMCRQMIDERDARP